MAAKKKRPVPVPVRKPKTVSGTNREHRAIDAEKLREDVKHRKSNSAA